MARTALRLAPLLLFASAGACASPSATAPVAEDAGDPFAGDSSLLMIPFDAFPESSASDAVTDATLGADAADGAIAITSDASEASAPADPNRILLNGTIVTPDVSFDGQVLVESGVITCVQAGTACASEPGANGATILDTHGVIAPGLIDTHNHILFDVFDDSDWLPSQVYTNHNQWPNEPRYKAMLDVKQCLSDASQGKPTWCPSTYDGAGSLKCEMDKWGELKGMIAGTTSIVGLPGTGDACFKSLARSIDVSENGLGIDSIQTSALFPPSKASGDSVCANFTSMKTNAYLIHCGEGTDSTALAEWTKLGTLTTTSDCLEAPQTVITHATAFTSNEFGQMASAGMKLTWSPRSNVALYGSTTNIPAALDAGVPIALAPDWSMGGSQNMLDEMRFANAWDDAHFGNRLTARDLVLMSTKNAASALGLADKIGSIAVGLAADLMVVDANGADPYASILAATPANVKLTMVGGQILYGDVAVQSIAPQNPGCETLDICGTSKFLCVAQSTPSDKLDQTYAEIESALSNAMLDVDSITPDDGYNFAPLAKLVICP